MRNGKTTSGKQRWLCKACRTSRTNRINNDAKQLKVFLDWLFSKQRQLDMPSQGRTFRNHTSRFWSIWPLPPVVDEIHRVVHVDGIHIARNVVVLIACSEKYVLGWYLARSENSRSWAALLSRIAPPHMVVTDGGSGFEKARRLVWPETEVQRCTFHAFCQVRRYTTTRPNLEAGVELYALAKRLLDVKEESEAYMWVVEYLQWCERWDGFLKERTVVDGRSRLTHERLVKAKRSVDRLVSKGTLFTFLDDLLTIGGPLPAMNNQIEGGVNAPLRQMLREHRGMSTIRRVKAVFWWCYMNTECHLGYADILKVMPTDGDIEAIYRQMTMPEQRFDTIPQWGDAIVWSELHNVDPWHDSWRHDWD